VVGIDKILISLRGTALETGMKRLTLIAAACVAFVVPAFVLGPSLGAQTPPNAFEVATVKPNKSGDGRVMLGMQPGGRFNATNVPLRMLLRQAFNVQDFQIVGGPDWLTSDRFDVVAKAPEGEFNVDTMRPMLRSLLVDRFKLVHHNENRDMPIYSLMKARSDGKLGPNITPAAVDCATVMRGRRGGGPPPAPPQPGQKMECGFMIGFGRMNAGGMPMTQLAQALSPQVGRIVLDKTELTGNYDFELTYSPEGLGSAFPGGGPQLLNGGPPPVDPNLPNVFTALQEQLGLKLDSQRGPVDVVVIDRVEQPVAD
jgi:bla regulator protein blaR1